MLRTYIFCIASVVCAGPASAQASVEGGHSIICTMARFNPTRPTDETFVPPAQFHMLTLDVSPSGKQSGGILDPGGFVANTQFQEIALFESQAVTVVFSSETTRKVLQTSGGIAGSAQEAEIRSSAIGGDGAIPASEESIRGSCRLYAHQAAGDTLSEGGEPWYSADETEVNP